MLVHRLHPDGTNRKHHIQNGQPDKPAPWELVIDPQASILIHEFGLWELNVKYSKIALAFMV